MRRYTTSEESPPEIHRISSHNATPHTSTITPPLYTPTTTHISRISLIPDLEPPPAHEEEQTVHHCSGYFEDPVHPHGPPPSPTPTAQECPPTLCVLSFYHPPVHDEPDECPPTLCAAYRSRVSTHSLRAACWRLLLPSGALVSLLLPGEELKSKTTRII